MPRKAFLNDLENSAQPGRFPHISSVRAGADDGSISFAFISESLPTGEIFIEALVPEVSEYPKDHSYYLYTISPSENVPQAVSEALELIQVAFRGCSLIQMLSAIPTNLEQALSRGLSQNPTKLDNESDDESDDGAQYGLLSEDEYDGDDDLWSPKSSFLETSDAFHGTSPSRPRTSGDPTSRRRLRSDLQAAKRAGFKVGILGDLDAGGFVCISVRAAKLGLSEEAMQAWGLQRKHYVLLMIRFEQGYKTLEHVSEEKGGSGKTEMRVALSERYKPSFTDAVDAFTRVPDRNQQHSDAADPKSHGRLQSLFIGRPLNDLLRDRFSGIVKYRLGYGFSWTASETFFNEIQGKSASLVDTTDPKYFEEDNTSSRAMPPIMTADHFRETQPGAKLSFPLIAMQFVLRHFGRCTEFCLVCHCKIDATFEALKPYVCSKPLCLYQYMTLGFGPSIEWEILAQPYVVDLLVSFCYASARLQKLKEFPIGMDLRVPVISEINKKQASGSSSNSAKRSPVDNGKVKNATKEPVSVFTTKFDADNMELQFDVQVHHNPVKVGDWIAITSRTIENHIHARVEDITEWPVVKLTRPGVLVAKSSPSRSDFVVASHSSSVSTSSNTPPDHARQVPASNGPINVNCFIYNQPFDTLDDGQKRNCITILLDTLPSILDIKDHLERGRRGQDPSLKNWRGKISESALNLLRWIIASNRSCIMQVDRYAIPAPDGDSPLHPVAQDQASFGSAEDRVSGMNEWMQFRFAQGAPDKEQRFIDCVNEVSKTTKKKFPTLFAWHGSPLWNWHSIVRQGLNFDQKINGRAFGNGVYMSNQCGTSMGYSQIHTAHMGISSIGGLMIWPNSRLRVTCAIALNEVVNCPDQFVSKAPHYVVHELDWIQTRYLFVKSDYQQQLGVRLGGDSLPSRVYEQDPALVAIGQDMKAITIPITAVSKSRRPVLMSSSQPQRGHKKSKLMVVADEQTAEQEEDDAASIITDEGDREILNSSEDEESISLSQINIRSPLRAKRPVGEQPKTDFIPGTLDVSSLKMLKEPKDASTATTKTLLQALRSTLRVQDSTPVHELGWYIDRQLVTNVYQWMIELHSFDATLPLARDMKTAKVSSIVLEMRFTNQFPFSSPFVRVVRPRFLPFQAGGGGYVTAGGAICMELLTNTGWLLGSSIESVLLQIRMAMSSTEPPARLEMTGSSRGGSAAGGTYGVAEAIQAYRRACAAHGWTPAKDLDTLHEG